VTSRWLYCVVALRYEMLPCAVASSTRTSSESNQNVRLIQQLKNTTKPRNLLPYLT
jgi:hypothetical protein